ncbi:hypothetical protein [Aminobacter phage Erebus]|nr:hypothetical protein [Aminobacter phage Erebus]
MAHEVEQMAFANEVPWHGLGNRLEVGANVDTWLEKAGLNWNVKLHPTFAQVDDKLIRVPNKSALIRDLDNKVLTTASDNWKPIQNREVLEFFNEYARAGGATLETAGSLRGGKMVWGLANLGHGFTTNNGRDAVKGYVLFASPHEAGKASSIRVTGTRVVCANTMAIALGGHKGGIYTQNHLKDFDFDTARDTIGLAHESMLKMELNAKALEALSLSEYDTVRVLAKHFQPAKEGASEATHVKALIDDVESRNQAMHEVLLSVTKAPGAVPGNAWGVINAVTFWADHIAGRSKDARMTKAWFGENAKIKQDVEADLLALVA